MSNKFIYITIIIVFLPSCYILFLPFSRNGIHFREHFMLCDSNFNSDNKLANKILHRFINKDNKLLAKDDYDKTIYFQYDDKTIYDSMKTAKLDNGVILKSKKDEKYFLTNYNSLFYQKS